MKSPAALPAAPEVERAVLACCLLDEAAAATVAGELVAADFAEDRHRAIFAAVRRLVAGGSAVDLRTVEAALDGDGELESVGGLAYLAGLDVDLPDVSGLPAYVAILRDRAARRAALWAAERAVAALSNGAGVDLSALAESLVGAAGRLTEAAAPARRVWRVGFRDLASLDLPRRAPLLGGWLTERSLSILYGPRGFGKTHAALGTAWAVATGSGFAKWTAPGPAGVLFVDAEMPGDALRSRLQALAEGDPDADEPRLAIVARDLGAWSAPVPPLRTPAGRAFIEAQVEDGDQLMVLDNFAALGAAGEEGENSAAAVAPFLEWLVRLRRRLAVLLVCHAGKDGARGPRGSSALTDPADAVISVSRPDDYTPAEGARMVMTFEKARHVFGAEVAGVEIAPVAGPNGRGQVWTWKKAATTPAERIAEYLAECDEEPSSRAIAKVVGVSRATVSRQLPAARSILAQGVSR